MLIHYAFPRFANLRINYTFQQNGVPAHHSDRVRNHLDDKRPTSWVGGGPVYWPPRSPDLTPPDFFLWVHIKSNVYDTPIYTIEELKTCIRRECRNACSKTLHKVWNILKLRPNYLSQVNGAHIESLLT